MAKLQPVSPSSADRKQQRPLIDKQTALRRGLERSLQQLGKEETTSEPHQQGGTVLQQMAKIQQARLSSKHHLVTRPKQQPVKQDHDSRVKKEHGTIIKQDHETLFEKQAVIQDEKRQEEEGFVAPSRRPSRWDAAPRSSHRDGNFTGGGQVMFTLEEALAIVRDPDYVPGCCQMFPDYRRSCRD